MKKPKSEYVIQTVTNALRVLEAFRDREEVGVTELSVELGLHKNNVFRLLATLELQGYVDQSPRSERYRLGVRCLELGRAFSRSRSLLRSAHPVLVELADRAGESAHLAVLRDFDVVHLDGVPSDRLVGTGLRVGQRLPVHCTALGKVLLGGADEEVQEEYDRTAVARGLEPRTRATIVDRDKFFEHIRSGAAQGYAVDSEECEPGLCCAAAPVFDSSGVAVAAISVSGPVFRLDEQRLLGEIVPLVSAAAERLSRDLGYGS
ncbi:MAG: IclR family transcriptional regulator [Myxococcota bacterium]